MKYLTIPELAKILGVSRISVYKKVKTGKIKAIKTGRNYAIPVRFVEELFSKKLDEKQMKRIDSGIKKVIQEYGETLRLLGKE